MKSFLLLISFLFLSLTVNAAEWTLFVFMNADNNLCEYSYKDINELLSVKAGEQVNIVVAHDCDQQGDSRLIQIKDGQEIILDSGKEYDMGDWQFFADTAISVKNSYPAKKFMAVIWNHGGGWKKAQATRGISYDDQSGNHINTPQLGWAMEKLGHTDILGMDACLMQMIEVDYEVAPFVDFVIASENSEPADGWDYAEVVKGLLADDVIKYTIDGYINYYDEGTELTLSAIDTSKLAPIVERIAGMAVIGIDLPKRMAGTPRWSGEFFDIGYLLPDIGQPYLDAIVYERHTEKSSGMSIYVNMWSPKVTYTELRFNKATNWFTLL